MFQQFLPPPIYKFVAVGGKIFVSTPKRQYWLWSKPSLLLSRYRGSFPGVKQPGREDGNSYPSRSRMCKGRPLLPLFDFKAWTGIVLPFTINPLIHPIKIHPSRQRIFLPFTHTAFQSHNNYPLVNPPITYVQISQCFHKLPNTTTYQLHNPHIMPYVPLFLSEQSILVFSLDKSPRHEREDVQVTEASAWITTAQLSH